MLDICFSVAELGDTADWCLLLFIMSLIPLLPIELYVHPVMYWIDGAAAPISIASSK